MGNYKIRVNNEAESKEAQELFFELGYSWFGWKKHYICIGGYRFITAYQDEMLLIMDFGEDTNIELTLPQLRDLVVLKRNDINDATHTDEDRRAYLDSEGKYHFYIHAEHKWEYSLDVQYVGKYLKPINQPKDPALISGAEDLSFIKEYLS